MNLRKSTMISGLLSVSMLFLIGIGCTFAQMDQTKTQTKDSKTKDSKDKMEEKTLVGRWKSDVATVEIRDDGKMTINGQLFNYRLNGSTMTISNNQETADLPFQLDGDTLTVQAQGRDVVYKRLVSQRNDDEVQSGGSNPPELVGKWCYMSNVQANNGGGRMSNTCFTLNGDGTYEYYSETNSSNPNGGTSSQDSDAGRWSATATTLTSHSNKGETRTFTLEKRNHPKNGDPMLMVDGDAFVTFNQRQPW